MRTSIIFSCVYILIYCWVLNYSNAFVVLYMVVGWPFIMLWVIYSILTDKHPPAKTFDEYFYQDEEIRRS